MLVFSNLASYRSCGELFERTWQ